MRLINELWQDEYGLILSAEAVTVGTLGVLGAVAGLNMATTAVDEELKEFAYAIRSLDQSYGFVGQQSCRAWSAGSSYRQPDVQVSISELCADGATDIRAIQEHVGAQRNFQLPPAPHPQADTEAETPVAPNQIPVPSLKSDKADPVKKDGEMKKDGDKKPVKKSDKKKEDRDED